MTYRIAPVALDTTAGTTRQQLDGFQAKLGTVPAMMRTMANSPAVLDAYVALSGALGRGTLGGKLGELVATTIAEANGCTYCLAAHAAIGGLIGVPAEALHAARTANSGDARTAAALRFAQRVTETRGQVTDADVADARAAGFTDGQLGELVAHVALNVFTNYFNLVAGTVSDFPEPAPLAAGVAA
jgi:uncharacterized peroxidase-related enzyme